MPDYDFQCAQCRKKFTLQQTYDEHDRGNPCCGKVTEFSVGIQFFKTQYAPGNGTHQRDPNGGYVAQDPLRVKYFLVQPAGKQMPVNIPVDASLRGQHPCTYARHGDE